MNPIFLSLLSGLLWGLSFPPFDAPVLAWFCLVPLLLFDDTNGPFFRPSLNRFFWGWFSGFVANLLIFFWIWDTFEAAGLGFLVTLNCWVALGFVMGLYPGIFLLLFGFFHSKEYRILLGSFFWVLLDIVKSHILTGFPWALLSHTQVGFLSLIQVASFFSAHGVTFILLASNISLAVALRIWVDSYFSREPRLLIRVVRNLWIFGVAFGLVLWGKRQLHNPQPQRHALHVAILQGNIDQYQKWDDTYENYIRQKYERLIAKAVEKKVDLILWPESAVPGWIPNDEHTMAWLTRVIEKSNTYHIVGAVSQRDGKEFNSAFFFDPSGKILDVYDKRHLVPFGEYIPFGGFLKRWVPYLGQLGTFDAGLNPKQFHLPVSGQGVIRIEPNVCYEAIFPFRCKADVIVNITNDAWYLKTGAPAQHYAANIYRAIENNKPVVRAANTGISAFIDAQGRELFRSNLMEEGVFVGTIYSSSGSDHL